MNFKVALTGGIACGKSVIAQAFEKLAVKVIDTDILSRKVVQRGSPLLGELTRLFSPQILTGEGELDRKALRALVFSDSQKLTQLNALMHPAILKLVQQQLAAYAQEPYVLVAVPLLFELNWQSYFDRILVADCAEEVQLKRVCKRDHISEELAQKMLCRQVSRATRRALAQDLIETDKLTLIEIDNNVLKLDAMYRKLASNINNEF